MFWGMKSVENSGSVFGSGNVDVESEVKGSMICLCKCVGISMMADATVRGINIPQYRAECARGIERV